MGWKDAKAGSGFYFTFKNSGDTHTLVILGEAEVVQSRFGNKRVLVNAADAKALDGEKAGILPLNITTGEKLSAALEAETKKSKVGKCWVTITRHGTGMRDTKYDISVGKKLSPTELKKVKGLKLNDLLNLDNSE